MHIEGMHLSLDKRLLLKPNQPTPVNSLALSRVDFDLPINPIITGLAISKSQG